MHTADIHFLFFNTFHWNGYIMESRFFFKLKKWRENVKNVLSGLQIIIPLLTGQISRILQIVPKVYVTLMQSQVWLRMPYESQYSMYQNPHKGKQN